MRKLGSSVLAAYLLLTLAPRPTDARVARVIEPTERVNVTVVDEAGTPVEGIEVLVQKSNRRFIGGGAPKSAWNSEQPIPLQVLETVARKSTDKDGKVTIEVPPGRYRVSAFRAGLGRAGEPITLEKGKPVDVKLTLRKT